MANHEARPQTESVDLFLAFSRTKDGVKNRKCIRTVIRDYDLDLAILEAKLKLMGGVWRIHKTVNSRDTEKARKWLIHKLIDNPEFAGCVDSLWRTALLQPEHIYGEKKFMFDVDTQEREKIEEVHQSIIKNGGIIIESHMSPKGIHIITTPFNTIETCQLSDVSLIRDGYVFIKRIENESK